jgi:hypothetical protein
MDKSCIYGSLNDIISILDCMASNDRMKKEGCKMMGSQPNFKELS